MKKILLTGLSPTTTEAGVRSWLSGFGSVANVDLVRKGNANAPLAIIEMDITDELASFIVSRISS
jgi:RNA recognition motif